jgi:signal transduction histidine kinase
MRLWPRSLAGRTATILVLVLVVVQGVGLTIHGMDRVELQRLADGRDLGTRAAALYRAIVTSPPETWAATVQNADTPPGEHYSLENTFPRDEIGPAAPADQRLIRPYLGFGGVPQPLRPKSVPIRGAYEPGKIILIAAQLPDDRWLIVRAKPPPARPWHSARFLLAFAIMTATAALLSFWAVTRMTAPLRVLSEAAERLGRDVNAAPLPEGGPTEVAQAAAAFNTMASRIRRFVADRTFLLTAIGHDLKTPITRLKLRAEWMEDDEQRRKMLADLDELESMVQATLAFGRDVAGSEPATKLDLPALLRTVMDEATDARPGANATLCYEGPETLPILARPVALKRACANLVGNALAYGGSAKVLVKPLRDGLVLVHIDDEGPGIPLSEMDRVFEPFYRLETSRNRETGGTGLGLPITRNILRAHGGDVTLSNRAGGGLRATMTLPA